MKIVRVILGDRTLKGELDMIGTGSMILTGVSYSSEGVGIFVLMLSLCYVVWNWRANRAKRLQNVEYKKLINKRNMAKYDRDVLGKFYNFSNDRLKKLKIARTIAEQETMRKFVEQGTGALSFEERGEICEMVHSLMQSRFSLSQIDNDIALAESIMTERKEAFEARDEEFRELTRECETFVKRKEKLKA